VDFRSAALADNGLDIASPTFTQAEPGLIQWVVEPVITGWHRMSAVYSGPSTAGLERKVMAGSSPVDASKGYSNSVQHFTHVFRSAQQHAGVCSLSG
jgi:hypothetical protein